MNCQFYGEKGDIFLLPSEPFLISDAIDPNIFGMHTEQRFMLINRDYLKSMLSFTTFNGRSVNMKLFREQKSVNSNSAHVYVHKTTVLQPQSYSLFKSKLKNKNIDINSETLLVLNSIDDQNISTTDLMFVKSKRYI